LVDDSGAPFVKVSNVITEVRRILPGNAFSGQVPAYLLTNLLTVPSGRDVKKTYLKSLGPRVDAGFNFGKVRGWFQSLSSFHPERGQREIVQNLSKFSSS
jgi:hypothetical protein